MIFINVQTSGKGSAIPIATLSSSCGKIAINKRVRRSINKRIDFVAACLLLSPIDTLWGEIFNSINGRTRHAIRIDLKEYDHWED